MVLVSGNLIAPVVVWSKCPPTHRITSICHLTTEQAVVTGSQDGQLCLWSIRESLKVVFLWSFVVICLCLCACVVFVFAFFHRVGLADHFDLRNARSADKNYRMFFWSNSYWNWIVYYSIERPILKAATAAARTSPRQTPESNARPQSRLLGFCVTVCTAIPRLSTSK